MSKVRCGDIEVAISIIQCGRLFLLPPYLGLKAFYERSHQLRIRASQLLHAYQWVSISHFKIFTSKFFSLWQNKKDPKKTLIRTITKQV